MSALETDYASLDEDICECGEVYCVADGHRCNVRRRLRVRGQISNVGGPFLVKPVQHVLDEVER